MDPTEYINDYCDNNKNMDSTEYINKLISTFDMSKYYQNKDELIKLIYHEYNDRDIDSDKIIKLCKDINHEYNKTLPSYTKNELLGMYKNKNITYFLKILVMYHIFLKYEVELKNNIHSFDFEYTTRECYCDECNPDNDWDSCYEMDCTKDILYIKYSSIDNYVSHILNLELNDIKLLNKVLHCDIDRNNKFSYHIKETYLEMIAINYNCFRIMSGISGMARF